MSRVTEFGIIAVFQSEEGRLTVQPRMLFPSEGDAKRAGEIFAEVLGGAVAFSRVVDRATGFAEDGVIIAKFGVLADPSSENSAYASSHTVPRPQARPPLRENPERYILTFFEAQFRLCALARAARREAPPDFPRMALEMGEMRPHPHAISESRKGPLHQPSTRGNAEFGPCEARGAYGFDEACPDTRWFVKMTGAWALALAATDAEAAWTGARACAIEADEEAFFDRVLGPWIAHRFRRQPDADASRPELEGLVAARHHPRTGLHSTASSCG